MGKKSFTRTKWKIKIVTRFIFDLCVYVQSCISRVYAIHQSGIGAEEISTFSTGTDLYLKKNGFIVCDVRTLHSSQPIVRYWVETVRMHAAAAAAALVASNKWAEQTRKEKKNRRRERNRREKIFLICCFYAKLMKIIICFIGCVRTKHNFSGNACVDGYFKSWFFADAKFLTFTRITLHILIY